MVIIATGSGFVNGYRSTFRAAEGLYILRRARRGEAPVGVEDEGPGPRHVEADHVPLGQKGRKERLVQPERSWPS